MTMCTENPYLEADKKIVSEIYTSSESMDNLKVLCDIYGSRFPGTKGDFGSVRWMVKKLKSYGIENAHYESFTIPGWKRAPAKLRITAPIKKNIECISLPHSIGGEIEAKLVFLGDGAIEDYEKRKKEIKGNIVMVTSANPLGMTRFLHRSEKYMRSILAGAKGWIFMNHYPAYGPPTGGINPIIPAVGISHEDGSFLARMLERGDDVSVKIKTSDKNLSVTSYNVICDIPGTSKNKAYVLAGSHYDGHDISQGALDPASGTVTVLEIARILNMVKKDLKRRVRLVCFGAEETGLFGSYHYVEKHAGELKNLRFMLNLDSAGSEGNKGIMLHNFPELGPFIETAAEEMKADLPMFQRVSPYSDHWPFFINRVPCGTGADPEKMKDLGGRGYGHTKYDTVDKVQLTNLRSAASNYSRFLLRVANTDEWTAVRKSKKEIRSFIKDQNYDQAVALTGKVKAYIHTWKKIHPDTRQWLKRKSAW